MAEPQTRTADKKPEKYVGSDGKTHIRMVPVRKDIVKTESQEVDEISLDAIKKSVTGKNLSKSVNKATNKDKIKMDLAALRKKLTTESYSMKEMCCKNCGDMYGKPTEGNCMYDAYDKNGKNWVTKKEYLAAQKKIEEGAYLKGSIESRADAHEDQADHHNSQAEKAHKAGDKMAASVHKAAAKAHMKAASYFDKHLSKPAHLRPQAAGGATSQAAHTATQKANQYNEEVELEEGPFKGIGKMMMKRKLKKQRDAQDDAKDKAFDAAIRARDHPDNNFQITKYRDASAKFRAYDKTDKALKRLQREEVDEAVGTSAKYAGKSGMFGGKYTSKDRMMDMPLDKLNKIRTKRQAQNKAAHDKQDPKMSKMGYAKHMLDTDKADAKARKRGIDPKGKYDKYKKKNNIKDSVQVDEVLDRPGALDSYRKKADDSGNKARNSATRKILTAPKDGKRPDHSDELKTMRKRNKGQDMADRVAARQFRKSIGQPYIKKEEVELEEATGKYKATSEKSKSRKGGYQPHLKTPEGKTSYMASVSYKTHDHAAGEAAAYHKGYFGGPGKASELGAKRAVAAYRAKNKEHMHEEVEQIDEISGAKLGSYLVKARKDRDYQKDKKWDDFEKGDRKSFDKRHKKTMDREDGMNLANNKLRGGGKVPATESVEQVEEKKLTQKQVNRALASIKPSKKKPTLPKAPWEKEKSQKEASDVNGKNMDGQKRWKSTGLSHDDAVKQYGKDNVKKGKFKRRTGEDDVQVYTETYIPEGLTIGDGMGSWIKDFQASDAPQFAGKSNKEKRDMAIAAYLSKKREK